jgi:hypothetical protein
MLSTNPGFTQSVDLLVRQHLKAAFRHYLDQHVGFIVHQAILHDLISRLARPGNLHDLARCPPAPRV